VLGIEWLSKAALGDEIPCVPSSTTFVAASSHNGSLCSDEKHRADRKFKPDFRHRRCPGFRKLASRRGERGPYWANTCTASSASSGAPPKAFASPGYRSVRARVFGLPPRDCAYGRPPFFAHRARPREGAEALAPGIRRRASTRRSQPGHVRCVRRGRRAGAEGSGMRFMPSPQP